MEGSITREFVLCSLRLYGIASVYEPPHDPAVPSKHRSVLSERQDERHPGDARGVSATSTGTAQSSANDMNALGWRLHPLKRRLARHWAFSGNWRMTFKFDDKDVELVDYQDFSGIYPRLPFARARPTSEYAWHGGPPIRIVSSKVRRIELMATSMASVAPSVPSSRQRASFTAHFQDPASIFPHSAPAIKPACKSMNSAGRRP